jgi:hypothetical protein
LIFSLTDERHFRQSCRFVSPEVNPPPFSQIAERIAVEVLAAQLDRPLSDPRHLAFLAGLYRLALEPDEQESEPAVRAQRYLWDD